MATSSYRREQLLALRGSAAESSISLDKFNDEDTVEEHVLKNVSKAPSKSSLRSKVENFRPAPVISNPFGGPPFQQGAFAHQGKLVGGTVNSAVPKISPTPSVKRSKAEMLLKVHGSPPGVRVTAGGRIVPDTLSPLSSPKYQARLPVYQAFQRPELDVSAAIPNGFIAYDAAGILCQNVDGRVLPLKSINDIPQLHIAAPNFANAFMIPTMQPFNHPEDLRVQTQARQDALQFEEQRRRQDALQFEEHRRRHDALQLEEQRRRQEHASEAFWAHAGLNIAKQISALEEERVKLENERKELDKSEVLQRNAMTAQMHQQIIARRRELVVRIDDTRKGLISLKKHLASSAPIVDANNEPHVGPGGCPRADSLRANSMTNLLHPNAEAPAAHLHMNYAAQYHKGISSELLPPYGQLVQGSYHPWQVSNGWPAFESSNGGLRNMGVGLAQLTHDDASGRMGRNHANFADEVASKLRSSISYTRFPLDRKWDASESSAAHAHQDTNPSLDAPEAKKTSEASKAAAARTGLNPASPSYEPRNTKLSPTTFHVLPQFLTHTPAETPELPNSDIRKYDPNDLLSQLRDVPEYTQREHGSSSSVSTHDFFPNSGTKALTQARARHEADYVEPQDLQSRAPSLAINAPPSTPQRGPIDTIWTPTGEDKLGALLTKSEKRRLGSKAASMQEVTNTDAILTPADRRLSSWSQELVCETQYAGLESEFDCPKPSALPTKANQGASPMSPEAAKGDARASGPIPSNTKGTTDDGTNAERDTANHTSENGSAIGSSKQSDDFEEGYRAGISRSTIPADRAGEFIDGYCAGLRESIGPTQSIPKGTVTDSANEPVKEEPTETMKDHATGSNSGSTRCASNRKRDTKASDSHSNQDVATVTEVRTRSLESVRVDQGPSQTLKPTAPVYIPSRAASILCRDSISSTGEWHNKIDTQTQFAALSLPVTATEQRKDKSTHQGADPKLSKQYTGFYPGQMVYGHHYVARSTYSVSSPQGLAQGMISQYDGSKDEVSKESSKGKLVSSTPPRKSSVSPKKLTLSPRLFCPSPTRSGSSKTHARGSPVKGDPAANKENERGNLGEDDPEKMTMDQKYAWRQKWKGRFAKIKREQEAEVTEYKMKNPLPGREPTAGRN